MLTQSTNVVVNIKPPLSCVTGELNLACTTNELNTKASTNK